MSQLLIQAGCYQCPPCGSPTVVTIPGSEGPIGPIGPIGPAGGGLGSFDVYTFAELKAIPTAATNRKASVSGEFAPFVGQFRMYMWDNASGAPEVVPSVMTPDDNTGFGRWIQVF